MRITIAIISAILISGCVADRMNNVHDDLIKQGQPPQYADGYADGCSSGESAAGNPYAKLKKDVSRFNSDKLYNQGWTDGFAICKGKYDSISRAVNSL